MPETVWAIHNFEAEAEDEISFHIGEPIVINQKDELYQDGWWEVRKKKETKECLLLWSHLRKAPVSDVY